MYRPWYLDDDREEDRRSEPSRLGFVGFLFGLATGGLLLWKVAGPPHLPASLPSWETVVITLQGTEPPLGALAYILTTAAWLLWLWIVGSLVLRLTVGLLDAISHGATWARSLRLASDWVTLPVVRKVADGAIVAVIVVTLVSRAPRASAAPLESPAPITAMATPPALSQPDSLPRRSAQVSNDATYTVQAGDTLWTIAEHFYGDGQAYRQLVDANAGHRMLDGRVFTRAGVIQPGWVLRIPEPTIGVEEARIPSTYVVHDGDTLREIAARNLGDEMRWPVIFELNHGTAHLPDGRTLTNPDLIWPGLSLRLQPPTQPHLTAPPVAPSSPPASKPIEPVQLTPPATVRPTIQPTISPVLSTATPETTPTTAPMVTSVPTIVPTTPLRAATPARASGRSPVLPITVAVGASAVAAGTAFLARRKIRRSLREPPIGKPAIETVKRDEFVDGEFARAFAHRLRGGDGEPVLRVAAQALRFFAEHGIPDVVVIQATQNGTAMSLLFSSGLLLGEQLRACAEEFGARFSGKCLASLTADHDVLLQLGRANLAAIAVLKDEAAAERLWLLPVGIGAKQEILWVNWRELGHVLVAGLPGGGADVVLTSLVCALAARGRPEEVRFWTIASPRTVPAELADLPQQAQGIVDMKDVSAVQEVLGCLRAELGRRMRCAEEAVEGSTNVMPAGPELVLVVEELDDLPDDEGTLDLIGTYGAMHGVRLVAATTCSDSVGDDRLGYFATRLVLQTLDDDESICLLGQPNATALGSAEFILRLSARAPTRLRGFRVSADHLAELVHLTSEAYHQQPKWSFPATVPEDEPVVLAATSNLVDRKSDGTPGVQTHGVPSEVSVDEVARSPVLNMTVIDRPHDEKGTDDIAASGGLADQKKSANGHLLHVAMEVESEPLPHEEADAVALAPGHASYLVSSPDSLRPSSSDSSTDRIVDESPIPAVSALIQIQCFGDFRVRSGERELNPLAEEKASHRAWEVLAFLAAHPAGPVSKEKLFAAIWPDANDEAAANCLRQALFRLRTVLSRQIPGVTSDVVRNERDGTCRLDSKQVSSDVQEFLSLCNQAPRVPPSEGRKAWERALTLYRGDLFDGRGTRTYTWVDERDGSGTTLREQYREQYLLATQRLARLYCRMGQPELAIPLLKGLLKAEPTLEDVVRDLYRCYRQLEDLGSLIREDRHLRQALREGLYDPNDPDDDPEQYEPEEATINLYNEIRAELEARSMRTAPTSTVAAAR